MAMCLEEIGKDKNLEIAEAKLVHRMTDLPYKRKEVIGDATLYLGDCVQVMPLIDAGSVQLLWTDPPYGHGNHDGDWNARLNEHRGIESKICGACSGICTLSCNIMLHYYL